MRTVTTTGTGTARIAPDRATVRVSVVARAAAPAGAFETVAAAVSHATEIALRHTQRAHVASDNLNLWPWHGPDGHPQGFEARHSLVIGCPDLPSAQDLISDLVSGIGDPLQLDGLSLEVTDPESALVTARDEAFASAKARAEQLAGLAGAQLGAVQTLALDGARQESVAAYAGQGLAKASIEPGETALSASVSVTWELLDL